jgi:hypothetical protein
MLIRDPVDRLVSHINDNRRRGSKHQRKHTVEELTNMEDWLVTTPHPSADLEKV